VVTGGRGGRTGALGGGHALELANGVASVALRVPVDPDDQVHLEQEQAEGEPAALARRVGHGRRDNRSHNHQHGDKLKVALKNLYPSSPRPIHSHQVRMHV
jgi:hypothetical protein